MWRRGDEMFDEFKEEGGMDDLKEIAAGVAIVAIIIIMIIFSFSALP
jgi:hypothetical protein